MDPQALQGSPAAAAGPLRARSAVRLRKTAAEDGPTARELSLARFWAPRYWPTWLVLAILPVIGRWPLAWQFATGRRLGRWFMRLRPGKRRVARRNLEVCFPELAADEREDLVVRSFESVGISLSRWRAVGS